MNKNETEQFADLKFFFMSNRQAFSNVDNLTLEQNMETPSNARDFIANADAIIKKNNNPFLYIQNVSISHDTFYRKSLSMFDNEEPKSSLLYVVGVTERASDVILKLCNDIVKIIDKKSNYINWPKGRKGNPILFVTSYSHLTPLNKGSVEWLGRLISEFVNNHIINSKYKKIIIAFRNKKENSLSGIPHEQMLIANERFLNLNPPFTITLLPYLSKKITPQPSRKDFEFVGSLFSYNNIFVKKRKE